MINFEKYIVKIAKTNNVDFDWQMLKFGYKRAVIHCDNWDKFNYLYNILTKRKQIYIESWHCSDGGFFEGNIYIMAPKDYEGLKVAQSNGCYELEEFVGEKCKSLRW